jgi:hypothetical protein
VCKRRKSGVDGEQLSFGGGDCGLGLKEGHGFNVGGVLGCYDRLLLGDGPCGRRDGDSEEGRAILEPMVNNSYIKIVSFRSSAGRVPHAQLVPFKHLLLRQQAAVVSWSQANPDKAMRPDFIATVTSMTVQKSDRKGVEECGLRWQKRG